MTIRQLDRWTLASVATLGVAAALGWWMWQRPRVMPTSPVRIGYVHDPPYMFQAPDGRPRGLSVEVVAEAARRAAIPLEWVFATHFHDDLRNGSVDLWPALTILPERQAYFHFSDPWMRTNLYLVVRGNGPMPPPTYTGLVGHSRLPITFGFREQYFPHATSLTYADGVGIARALCAGEVPMALLALADAARALNDKEQGCVKAQLRPFLLLDASLRLGIASRHEHAALADRLRLELDRMAEDGTLSGIVTPYSFYEASDVLAVFELLQSRARARSLQVATVGLSIALAVALALVVALYRAKRAAERETARRLAVEAQLNQAQKLEAIGQLAGAIAHDFNNVLTIISGYCEILLHNIPDDSKLRASVNEMQKAGDRASALVRQLLTFSRKQPVEPRSLSLNAEVDDLQTMLPVLVREDITLSIDLRASPDVIRADATQLQQVLLNLAVNARDAMPDGGRLEFATGVETVREPTSGGPPPGVYVRLSVSDTGVAMDETTRARIFEPFFTTKPAGSGTGLGLATVYGVVTQAGGWISVHSELGQGTRFDILFPAETH